MGQVYWRGFGEEKLKETAELYKRFRPRTLDAVVGQTSVVKTLKEMIANKRVPHSILLTGNSGVGKTTIARILQKELQCSSYDFIEMNAAKDRGIDFTREIQNKMHLAPAFGGNCRIWLIDEAQQLTSPSQSNLLKTLEDTPAHVYFMLATTDPQKLLKTIRTRCTEFALRPLPHKEVCGLVESIAEKAKAKLSTTVIEKIADNSEGSARKALVLLDKIYRLDSEAEMIEAIEKASGEQSAFQICRLLMDTRTKWGAVSNFLKEIEGEEPEGLRRMILSYASKVLLGGGFQAGRAFNVITAFGSNFFDSGRAGLIASCYEVINGGK